MDPVWVVGGFAGLCVLALLIAAVASSMHARGRPTGHDAGGVGSGASGWFGDGDSGGDCADSGGGGDGGGGGGGD